MKNTVKLIINAGHYEWATQYITGTEIKSLAGIAANEELYLSIKQPWTDERIENETVVDLARPGIEHFYVKRPLKFTINGTHHEWKSQYINGAQIREIGKIPEDDDIFLLIPPPYENELINNEKVVDLARPGIEHFISKPCNYQIELIVTGREKPWNAKKISFSEVVVLAFGVHHENDTTAYTVTYKRGPDSNPEGSMVKGNIVNVKNKMIFNVTATNKS